MESDRGRHLTSTTNLNTCMHGCAFLCIIHIYICVHLRNTSIHYIHRYIIWMYVYTHTHTYSTSVDLLYSLGFTESQEYLSQSAVFCVQPLALMDSRCGFSEFRGTES